MQIKNKIAIVTGGASGLGAATVRHLHFSGAHVYIADLKEKEGNDLANELGSQVTFIKTDVSSNTSMNQAINTVLEQKKSLHLLVNCAGIALAEKVLGKEKTHDLDRFIHILQVNLVGTFNALRLSAAAMINNQPTEEGERGVIINTASVAAFEGQIGQAAYAASKGGIAALTLPSARELAHWGIRVLAIAPGIFDTPLLAGLPEKARASLGQQVPFPSRLGHPQEYALLVEHIISNIMLNGETIRLDGGLRMAPR